MVKDGGGGGEGGEWPNGGQSRECLGRRSLGIQVHARNEGNAQALDLTL